MNSEENIVIEEKKPWNKPELMSLDSRKTGGGPIEESYEDDRYINPISG